MVKHEPTSQLALAGLRVLEIGSGAALAYAGKLFADFGAEVIKVEDPDGDALRTVPPLLTSSDTESQSALNAGSAQINAASHWVVNVLSNTHGWRAWPEPATWYSMPGRSVRASKF